MTWGVPPIYNKPSDRLPSGRTSLLSSYWSTAELYRWSPNPEPDWRSYNHQSPRCVWSPVWEEPAGGSVWTRCPAGSSSPGLRGQAAGVPGRQAESPARFLQFSLLAAGFLFLLHSGASSHGPVVPSGARKVSHSCCGPPKGSDPDV